MFLFINFYLYKTVTMDQSTLYKSYDPWPASLGEKPHIFLTVAFVA